MAVTSSRSESVRILDIAVIIVTFRSAQLTIANLRALVVERLAVGLKVRAVVVDNASGDIAEISAACDQYGWNDWVQLVAAPDNGGFAFGCNLGVENAWKSAEPSYIYLLNPDAQVRPGAIATLCRFLESHETVGIAGSGVDDRNGQDWPIAFRFPSLIGEIVQGVNLGILTGLLEPWAPVRQMHGVDDAVDWVSGASMMIRAALFREIGGMDENYFLFFEETDFCRRAKLAGYSTWYVPESRVMHIGGQSTALAPNIRTRLPAYWFDSRRRYFAVTFGLVYALIVDLAALIAYSIGAAKCFIRRQPEGAFPYFIRDLVQHSIWRKRNRKIDAFRSRITGRTNHVSGAR